MLLCAIVRNTVFQMCCKLYLLQYYISRCIGSVFLSMKKKSKLAKCVVRTPRHVLPRHQTHHASTKCATSSGQDDGLHSGVLSQACEGLCEVNHHGTSQCIQSRRAIYCYGYDARLDFRDLEKSISAARFRAGHGRKKSGKYYTSSRKSLN